MLTPTVGGEQVARTANKCLERFEGLLKESAAGKRRVDEAKKRKDMWQKKQQEQEAGEQPEPDRQMPQRFEEFEDQEAIPLPVDQARGWRNVRGANKSPQRLAWKPGRKTETKQTEPMMRCRLPQVIHAVAR